MAIVSNFERVGRFSLNLYGKILIFNSDYNMKNIIIIIISRRRETICVHKTQQLKSESAY